MASRHLGQWFTPSKVADLVLALALPPRSGNGFPPTMRLLDPTCGEGVFLARAAKLGVLPNAVFGFDIDPRAISRCRQQGLAGRVEIRDFFSVSPERGNFDVIVGNPPYVRRERISPQQRHTIQECMRTYGSACGQDVDRLVSRGDLAALTLLHAIRFLRPGGRLAFIVSSALLDAGYAQPLWRIVETMGRIVAIVDSPRERWFADAAINTIIIVFERSSTCPLVRIANLHCSTLAAAKQVHKLEHLEQVANVHHVSSTKPEQWRVAVRACSVWRAMQTHAPNMLVPLGKVATIRRGVTSGANDIFYLTRQRAKAYQIETCLLKPLLRSPRTPGENTINISPTETKHLAVVFDNEDQTLDQFPQAAQYFAARANCATRATLRARKKWWMIPALPAQLFLTKAYAARFVQRFAPKPVVADQRLYTIYPNPEINIELLAAILNSTLTAFALESLGRASLGEGALEWTVGDAIHLPILDPRLLSPSQKQQVSLIFKDMAHRPIGNVTYEAKQLDRRALDLALVEHLPSDCPSLDVVHQALITAVRRRQLRATSIA